MDDTEIKFQISFKLPIWRNVLDQKVDAYFAYTTQSWWQLFNGDISAPFRETNYEPELYIRGFTNYDFLGIQLAGWSFGINHQSNGRAEPLSRSWNRIMARLGFVANDNLTFLVRVLRVEEDIEDDDNPDIEDFLGNGDVRAIWTPGKSTYTAMLRKGREEHALELTWSYPIGTTFRIYTQFYEGFGESMIDYNQDTSRFSIGISISDYLVNNAHQ